MDATSTPTERPPLVAAQPVVDRSRQRAARLVGALYLATMATAVFAESFVRGRLIVPRDAAATAVNLAAAQRLFRVALVADLVTVAGVVALTWGLAVVLAPVHHRLALLAASLRLTECAVAAAGIICGFIALRFVSGVSYLEAFDPDELAVFARFFLAGQGIATQIAFVFLGLGSTLFGVLWWRSRAIPRALALLGLAGSLLLALGSFAVMLFPDLGGRLGLSYMLPLGLYEVTIGCWLLAKPLAASRVTVTG